MYTFKKEERLCSEKLIQQLFNDGSSFVLYPFRISWLLIRPAAPAYPVQVIINAPKRSFKNASDRNLLKRRIREAYRLNKEELLYAPLLLKEQHLILSVHYIGKEILPFSFIEKKLKASMIKLVQLCHDVVVE